SSVMSKMCLLSEIATLLTRISMRPKRSTTALTTAATSLPLETSAMNSSASPPAPLIAPTTRSPRGLSTSTIATLAPSPAKSAARVLALAPTAQKDSALAAIAAAIRARQADILAANAKDVAEAKAAGATAAFVDRLALDERRIAAMADGLDVVRALADPVGAVAERWTRPNGMTIERVRVPIGVVGIIYESRPNVTADEAALWLKAGHADHLRGGLGRVARVQTEARVPVFAHLEGICHVYVDRAAKLDMARTILLNAKMRRSGVCGAAETLLVDGAVASTHLKPLVTMLLDAGCEVRGDEATRAVDRRVKPASEEDWSTEYLDAVISAKVVDGVDAAIEHIERFGSHHTDSIVTEDHAAAEKF